MFREFRDAEFTKQVWTCGSGGSRSPAWSSTCSHFASRSGCTHWWVQGGRRPPAGGKGQSPLSCVARETKNARHSGS